MKEIPVNGKPERAYRVSRTGDTETCDSSFVIKGATTREAEVVRIIFRYWAYERPLFLREGTMLTLDNIVSIVDPSPSVKMVQEVKNRHFDDILEWSKPPLYDASKDYEIKLKFPGFKGEMIQGSSVVSSPIKILTIDEERFIKELESIHKTDAEWVEKAANTEAHVKKVVNKAVSKEIVPIAEMLKKAILVSTPPNELQWWQNLRAAYIRDPAPTQSAKWHEVAHKVVLCAKAEYQKHERDRQCDYLSKTMLNGLIRKLNAPGASPTKIEDGLARNIRRYVAREEQKAKKRAKTRA